MEKPKIRVKCPGRFHELRELMYEDALPLILGRLNEIENTVITQEHLEGVWDLINQEIHNFDIKDPYYNSRVDKIRRNPCLNARSLVPLIETATYHVSPELVKNYCIDMGNSLEISEKLATFVNHPPRFFRDSLKREPSKIFFPCGKNLAGYRIAANFGIGTLSPGGLEGSGIRSDSPFLFEVSYIDTEQGGHNLAAVVGFWAQDNDLVVSQMQQCRNAHLPEGVKLGIGLLTVAEVAARAMGFRNIHTYCAKEHPSFYEHPDSWQQRGGEFVMVYDTSAKKLKFDGGRTHTHSKNLTSTSSY